MVAMGLTAAAVAGGTQWFVHGSYDWFWQYPGITGLGVYLLGVASAPGLASPGRGRARAVRAGVVAGAIALALVAVPLFVSDRYARQAAAEGAADPNAALGDLDRAAELNPLSDQALLAKGALAARLGARRVALDAFRQAADRVPRDYAPYLLIAQELSGSDPGQARAALARARRLNPRGPEVLAVQRQLERSRPRP